MQSSPVVFARRLFREGRHCKCVRAGGVVHLQRPEALLFLLLVLKWFDELKGPPVLAAHTACLGLNSIVVLEKSYPCCTPEVVPTR